MASQYNNIQSVTGDRVWSQMTLKGVQWGDYDYNSLELGKTLLNASRAS